MFSKLLLLPFFVFGTAFCSSHRPGGKLTNPLEFMSRSDDKEEDSDSRPPLLPWSPGQEDSPVPVLLSMAEATLESESPCLSRSACVAAVGKGDDFDEEERVALAESVE